MRLFVAVDTGPDIASAVMPIVAELKHRAERLAPLARFTWAVPSRVHLTLRFIADVDPKTADTIAAALERGVPRMPFSVEIGGVDVFPDRGAPRVFWLGLTSGLDGMVKLEEHLSTRLLSVGIPREERPFRPHVTLCRVRDASGLRPTALLQGLADASLGSFRVSSYTLFESRPTPHGPEYRPIVTSRLACQPVGS
jgi:RNA 2',3'-cyclic 3'-phosphodiesterase